MALAVSNHALPRRSPTLPRLHPALTLAAVFGAGSVYCPRPSFTVPGWVPQDPAVLDLVTGRDLTMAGETTAVCSDSVASPEGLRLLADAGLPVRARLLRFRGRDEYAAVLRDLQQSGARVVAQHVHDPAELAPTSCRIPPSLSSFLNNKGNLARLVPPDLLAARLVFPTDALPGSVALLAHGPVVLKVASDRPTAAGFDVWICREPEEVDVARPALDGAEHVVVEAFLDIRRNLCVHFVVEPRGSVRFLGIADQVCDARGRYLGNWIGAVGGVPSAAASAGKKIAEPAAALGYRGFAGLDMAVCADGRLRVFDLNFRVNGSTVAVLLSEEIRRLRGMPVMRLRSFLAGADFGGMIAGAREAVARGILVPLATYQPAESGRPADPPRLLGLVPGKSRMDVRRHEEELERCGLR